MMVNRRLVHDQHVRQFSVTQNLGGWDIREQQDQAVLRSAHYEDWHRVERNVRLFELRALELKRDGWIEN